MEQLAQLYKALSEETRIRIVMLLTQGELCVCDIQAVLDEPQSKISRHLAYLKLSGMVSSKRVGVWMHYLIKENVDATCKAQLAFMEENLSRLPQFLSDREKLLEFRKQKGCAAPPATGKKCRTGQSEAGKKAVKTEMKTNGRARRN